MRVTTEVELTDREQAFVIALTVAGHRPTRAAVESGWSASNARHLLKKEHVLCAIEATARNSVRVLKKLETRRPA